MARINELKHIQKQHSEEQMRKALQDFIDGKHCLRVPVADDDADIVLADTINELLESRTIVEEIAGCEPKVALDRNWDISCFYCGGEQQTKQSSQVDFDGLFHELDCVYVKARKLFEMLGKGA